VRVILVSLHSDALLPAWARPPVSPQSDAVAALLDVVAVQPDVVAVQPDVAGGQASARFLCAREQPHVLALRLAWPLRV
jgi:hypothetical protein